MNRTVRMSSLLPAVALFTLLAAPPPRPGVAQVDAFDPWRDRLEALRPVDPLAYFELAEEVAAAPPELRDVELGRQLFALAGVLDRTQLGRSACLALADLARSDGERRGLLALAALLGGGPLDDQAAGSDERDLVVGVPASAVEAVTEAFSYYRRGRGPKALERLEDPRAMALLERCGPLLAGGARRFREDCQHYRGELRPILTEEDVLRMLQLELALLSGRDQRWSSEIMLQRTEPLIDVDPERLVDVFDVDPRRPYYRDGRWVIAP